MRRDRIPGLLPSFLVPFDSVLALIILFNSVPDGAMLHKLD